MPERLRVIYELTPDDDEDIHRKAEAIAHEQTVELPPEVVPKHLVGRVPGTIDSLEQTGENRWRCAMDFDPAVASGELTQTLNLLFGNISLQRGIRIVDIDWPSALLTAFGGPRHGIAGIRALTGVHGRALCAAALKPVGLDSASLASLARQLAQGGIDIIKDDHGITNQASAPFEQRLAQCATAIGEAGPCRYFPNVTAARPALMHRAGLAREVGCEGVLINPMLTGLDAIAQVRDEFGLAVMAHPSLTGGFFDFRHGIATEILLGDLFRLAGADAVIYPNVGGRFGFSAERCQAINHRLRRDVSGIAPALPVIGGGVAVDRAGDWAREYGDDILLLIGSSLYAQPDLEAAARALRSSLS